MVDFSDVAQECRTYGQFVENMKDIPEIEFQRRKSPYILQSLSLTALCRFECCREQLFIIDKKITVFLLFLLIDFVHSTNCKLRLINDYEEELPCWNIYFLRAKSEIVR